MEEATVDELQQHIEAQNVTINALTQRLYQLELQIVDMMSMSLAQGPSSNGHTDDRPLGEVAVDVFGEEPVD